jgi:hypothetical protein
MSRPASLIAMGCARAAGEKQDQRRLPSVFLPLSPASLLIPDA